VSSFSKTLAMLFGLLVFGVQVSDGAFLHLGEGRLGRLMKGIVHGVERDQYCTNVTITELCQGDRFAVGH